ncbi:MAG: hypothetical protein ACREGC_00355 [Minisyncoccia bacterium]
MIMDGVRNPYEVADALQEIVDDVTGKMKTFHRLFTFSLDPSAVSTLDEAGEVFNGNFSTRFAGWDIGFWASGPKSEIAVDQLVFDGTSSQFIGNTAEKLEKRRLLGSQFLAICRDHPNQLVDGTGANLFVLTSADEEVSPDMKNVFIARVIVGGMNENFALYAFLEQFLDDVAWGGNAKNRLFSPQR